MLSIKHHSLNDTFHDHKANAGIAANDKNEEELHELLIEGWQNNQMHILNTKNKCWHGLYLRTEADICTYTQAIYLA